MTEPINSDLFIHKKWFLLLISQTDLEIIHVL